MITDVQARRIAQEWISAWNSHDLELILSHYDDKVEFSSPFIIELLGEKSGMLHDKKMLAGYFSKGLSARPDLQFELIDVLVGAEGIVLYYYGVDRRRVAEVLMLDSRHKIIKVLVHYSPKEG
jgi:ketosteroid isomerase-like protein